MPPLATYEQQPAWLRNTESFFYGFSTLAATRTRLQLAAFDALDNNAQRDVVVLTKPDGWVPNPAAAAAACSSARPTFLTSRLCFLQLFAAATQQEDTH